MLFLQNKNNCIVTHIGVSNKGYSEVSIKSGFTLPLYLNFILCNNTTLYMIHYQALISFETWTDTQKRNFFHATKNAWNLNLF